MLKRRGRRSPFPLNLVLLFLSELGNVAFTVKYFLCSTFIIGRHTQWRFLCVKPDDRLKSPQVILGPTQQKVQQLLPAVPFLHTNGLSLCLPAHLLQIASLFVSFQKFFPTPATQSLLLGNVNSVQQEKTLLRVSSQGCQATALSPPTVRDTNRQRDPGLCSGTGRNASVFQQQNKCHHVLTVLSFWHLQCKCNIET